MILSRSAGVIFESHSSASAGTNPAPPRVKRPCGSRRAPIPRLGEPLLTLGRAAVLLLVAYVTDRAAIQLTATGAGSRQFGPPRVLADVQRGTRIVAADVNGDGIPDLAVAASEISAY